MVDCQKWPGQQSMKRPGIWTCKRCAVHKVAHDHGQHRQAHFPEGLLGSSGAIPQEMDNFISDLLRSSSSCMMSPQVAQLTEQASERSAGRNSEGAAETEPREDFQILGQGAYGVVYAARVNDREVAVKVQASCVAAAEVKGLIATATCRYCLRLVGFYTEDIIDGCASISGIKIPEGDTLWSVLTPQQENGALDVFINNHIAQRPLPFNIVESWSLQLVSAMNDLSRLNLAHNDLKPANVLINEMADLAVADMGGLQQGIVAPRSATQQPSIVTQGYCPPEYWREEATIGFENDAWAVGATIFEVVTGIALFQTEDQVLSLVQNHELLEKEIDEKLGMLAYRYPGIEAARVGRFKQVLKELLLPEAAQRIGGPWGRSFAELEQELTGPNFDWRHSVDQATFELYMAGEQGTPAAAACPTAAPAAHKMLDALAAMESAQMVPESMAAATPYVQNGLVPSPCGAWPEQPLVFSADCGFCSSNGDLPSPRHAAASMQQPPLTLRAVAHMDPDLSGSDRVLDPAALSQQGSHAPAFTNRLLPRPALALRLLSVCQASTVTVRRDHVAHGQTSRWSSLQTAESAAQPASSRLPAPQTQPNLPMKEAAAGSMQLCAAVSDRLIPSTLPQIAHSR
ncbi:hypothetical protein WJX84_002891 [Apatococcus fuscideae]|uniref:Protein kinase domain-containing protein n=1 Tax=Apatococcus fuscideae TaxID=2026836 RepID=A0AAW1THT5_9CHLO